MSSKLVPIRPSRITAAAPQFRVTITEQHVAVLDPASDEVMLALMRRERTFVLDDGPTGYHYVEKDVLLGDLDWKGRVAFSAGLASRVYAQLTARGALVEVDDCRRCPRRLVADDGTLAALDPEGRALVEAVLREPLGRIEVRSDREAVETCVLLGRAFPRTRFVVAVATRTQAYNLRRELEERLGERVGLAPSGVRRRGRRVLVSTFASVPRSTAGKWDVLLLPYGEESTGQRAIELATKLDFPRIYACVTPRRRADRLVALTLEQMAGPVIRTLDPHTAAVKVVVMPAPPCTPAHASTALECKRKLYWHNTIRNAAVAALGLALVAKDWKALRALGVARRDVPRPAGRPLRVAVLVESTEHGRALAALLPGWALRSTASTAEGATTVSSTTKSSAKSPLAKTKTKTVTESATKSPVEIKKNKTSKGAKTSSAKTTTDTSQRARTSVTQKAGMKARVADDVAWPVVVTVTYAAGHDVQADVLIRATGTRSPLHVKGFPAHDDEVGHALVIDFEDGRHPQTVEDTKHRLQDYRRRGMEVVAAPIVQRNNKVSERTPSGAPQSGPSDSSVAPGVGLADKPVQRSGRKRSTTTRSSGRRS